MSTDNQIMKFKEAGVHLLFHDHLVIDGVKIFASSYTVIPPYYQTAFQITQ
jgi:hypothetical protein